MKRLLVCAAVAAVLAPAALAVPRAMHPTLGATLLGKNEVPKGSPSAHGIVNLNLKAGAGQVCWTFELAGVSKPLAAHIHTGRAGASGPVFIALGKTYKAKGCAAAPKKMIEATIKGMASTVAVASRRAYIFLSAGASSAVCPAIA